MVWYWKKEGDRHYFVEAINLELKELAGTPGVGGVKREGEPDLEARIMEELVPALEEKMKEVDPKGKYKYLFLTSAFGTVYNVKPPRVFKAGEIFVMPYKRKPKWITKERVIDYSPENYTPFKEAYKTPEGGVVEDSGMSP